MTTLHLSRRERRVAVVGLLTIALAIFGTRAWPLLRDWRSNAVASATELLSKVQHHEELHANGPAIHDSLMVRTDRLAVLEAKLLDAKSLNAAPVRLTELLSHYAADAGVELSAFHIDSDVRSGMYFPRILVRAEGMADFRGLARLLQHIEGGATMIAVRALKVNSADHLPIHGSGRRLRIELLVEAMASIEGLP